MLDRVDEALQHVQPAWTPARAAAVLERLRPSRRRTMVLALTAAAAVAFLVGRWLFLPTEALTFPDGTRVRATSPATELRVAEDTPTRQVVQIVHGGARFEVAHIPGRTFRVQLHAVAVEVLGTIFRVDERGDQVRVQVERGRVRVLQGGQRRELGPGEVVEVPAGPLPPAAAAASPAPVAPPEAGTSGGVTTTGLVGGPTAGPVPPSTRPALAPSASRASVPTTAAYTPRTLLEAADRARRTGHPAAAMAALRMLVARFPDDALAPLAAFTLGLLSLDRRQPEAAAQAFSLARRLDPSGELAEDALGREVQAWYEAGRHDAAHDRAAEYQRLYPTGRRTSSVRRLGGLR